MFGRDFGTFDICERQKIGFTTTESSSWISSSKIASKIAKSRHGEKLPLTLSATMLYVLVLENVLTSDSNDPSFNVSEIRIIQTPSSGSIQVSVFGRTVLATDRTGSARIW
jgi:hypothetical protein